MMTVKTPTRLAVSTWSLHRTLGDPKFYGPETNDIPIDTHNNGSLKLVDVPARIAAEGIGALEICHFHLPSADRAYLQQVRDAAATASVEIWNLLIDAGDITHPTDGARDEAWVSRWVDVAHELGAKRVRIIAGKQAPNADTLERSRDSLLRLSAKAESFGLRVLIENWFDLLSTPDAMHWLINETAGHVGMLFDFGNWKGANKHTNLAQIARYAESCHCKPQFNADGAIERNDYVQCFDIVHDAGFSGPLSLIYDGPSADEFAGLAAEKAIAQAYVN